MSNTTSGRSIDPRFDPAFQPGYDPRADPTKAARVPIYDGAVDSARPQAGRVVEPPRAHYATDAEGPAISSRAPETGVPPRPSDAADVVRANDDLLDPAVPAGRNPFFITLWSVGVGFTLSGALLISLVKSLNDAVTSSPSANNEYIYLQVAIYCVPGAFLLGFGTIIGLLFVHARRWAARN